MSTKYNNSQRAYLDSIQSDLHKSILAQMWRELLSELPLSPVEALCAAVKEITERGE